MPNAVASPILVPVKKVVKAKKPNVAATHAPITNMVNEAIVALKDRKGSSLAAIKKYIDANNKTVNSANLAPFIKRYLKSAVVAGKLVQIKGTGATGSFKIGMVEKKVKKTTPTVKTPINAAMVKTPKKVARKIKTPKKIARKVNTPKKVVKKPITKKSQTPKTAAARKPIAQVKKSANKTATKR